MNSILDIFFSKNNILIMAFPYLFFFISVTFYFNPSRGKKYDNRYSYGTLLKKLYEIIFCKKH
jgi:hypothetical protein